MDIRTMKKLEKLGYSKDWLLVIKSEWAPKKIGRYKMRITDIDYFGDHPDYGVYIDTTRFDSGHDLSVIHKYFEGYAYVVTDTETNEEFDSGILDTSLFDVMKEYTGEEWEYYSREDLDAEVKAKEYRNESMIEKLTREVCELQVENAKLRMQLEVYKR